MLTLVFLTLVAADAAPAVSAQPEVVHAGV
jgi:hypothetical protein